MEGTTDVLTNLAVTDVSPTAQSYRSRTLSPVNLFPTNISRPVRSKGEVEEIEVGRGVLLQGSYLTELRNVFTKVFSVKP